MPTTPITPMMDARRRWSIGCIVVAMLVGSVSLVVRAQEPADESAMTWLGRADEAEEFLKTVDILEMEEIGTGVTKPWRATLPPGGPVAALVWKPIKPGIQQGFWESYKSEIAAYELDKLLELKMTPPTVERRVRGDLGAAVWMVTPQESWKEMAGQPTPPNLHIGRWNYQLNCAKMFHNLTYNRDPDMGNWLVDPAWNLIIIDYSRAFTPETGKRVHKLTRIDRDLWERIEALDEATLSTALGEWLSDREIRAILERREDMREDIDELVAEHNEAQVFVRFRPVATGGPASTSQPVGVVAGHIYGLVTEMDDLICLSADPWDEAPHSALSGLLGGEAEIFSLAEEVDGLTVARVTLSRSR